MITQNDLKKILSYDQETGIFSWKNPRKKTNIGKIAGCKHHSGYIVISIKNKQYQAHRLAWIYIYGDIIKPEIDHINLNKSDNRIINLREANRSENQLNKVASKHSKTQIKGVSWHKTNLKWRVQCSINKKQTDIGYFDDLEFAELVAIEARNKYHKEFARG
jgi:hypothetical protein